MEQRRREVNATIGTPFRNIHAIMHPSASGGTVVQLPPKTPDKVTMDRGDGPVSQPQKVAPVNDLLDVASQAVKKAETAQLTDFFDSVAITPPSSGTAARLDSNPFSTFAPVPPAVSSGTTPTIAQIPINPTVTAHIHAQHQGPVSHFGSPPGASFPYQQGHAPQMVNQNSPVGQTGQLPHGAYSNMPQQPPQQPGAYPSHPQNVAPVFHPPPNQSPTLTGPSHTITQPPLQRPPSSNLSQFDPFAKR